MTDTTPSKRGAKRRYESLVLVQAHVTPELRDWFDALPGNSNHERLQWLREQMAVAPETAACIRAMLERYCTGYNANDPEAEAARAILRRIAG